MKLEGDNIIEITDELSSEFEVSKVLREYPKDTVIVSASNKEIIFFISSSSYFFVCFIFSLYRFTRIK